MHTSTSSTNSREQQQKANSFKYKFIFHPIIRIHLCIQYRVLNGLSKCVWDTHTVYRHMTAGRCPHTCDDRWNRLRQLFTSLKDLFVAPRWVFDSEMSTRWEHWSVRRFPSLQNVSVCPKGCVFKQVTQFMFPQHGYKVKVTNITFKHPTSISCLASNPQSLQVTGKGKD